MAKRTSKSPPATAAAGAVIGYLPAGVGIPEGSGLQEVMALLVAERGPGAEPITKERVHELVQAAQPAEEPVIGYLPLNVQAPKGSTVADLTRLLVDPKDERVGKEEMLPMTLSQVRKLADELTTDESLAPPADVPIEPGATKGEAVPEGPESLAEEATGRTSDGPVDPGPPLEEPPTSEEIIDLSQAGVDPSEIAAKTEILRSLVLGQAKPKVLPDESLQGAAITYTPRPKNTREAALSRIVEIDPLGRVIVDLIFFTNVGGARHTDAVKRVIFGDGIRTWNFRR